jgi:hypothetical protein
MMFNMPESKMLVIRAVEPDRTPLVPEGTLGQVFGLTPDEIRLVSAVVNGNAPVDSTGTPDVSSSESKAQLERIFAKTQTSSELDLLRLLMSLR